MRSTASVSSGGVATLTATTPPGRSRSATSSKNSATALPLVVAITAIGLEEGHMRPDNAAALVGADMVSVLVFPLVALVLAGRTPAASEPSDGPVLTVQTVGPEA